MPGGAQYFSLLDLKDACSLSPFIQTQTFLPLNGGNLIPWKHLDSASLGLSGEPPCPWKCISKRTYGTEPVMWNAVFQYVDDLLIGVQPLNRV